MSSILDTTFNTTGKVINSEWGYSIILSINMQNDKILVAGYYNDNKLFIARYNTNGTIDSSFGVNGFIITNYIVNSNYKSDIMIVQSINKFIILCSDNSKFILLRYTENGELDNTFGVNGIVDTTYDFNTNSFSSILKYKNNNNFVITFLNEGIVKFQRYDQYGISVNSLTDTLFDNTNQRYCFCNTIDNSDNIIFAGRENGTLVNNYNDNKYIYCVYDSSNNLITSIGDNGLVINNLIANMNGYSSVNTDSDNNIIIVGDYNHKIMINKYNTNGVLIEQNLNLESDFSDSIIKFDNNGKIIIGIMDYSGDYRLLILYKLNADLTLDTSFNGNGTSIFSNTTEDVYIADIVFQSDNKILTGGSILTNSEEYEYYLLARLNNNTSHFDYLPNISNYKIKKIYENNNTSYYLLTLSNNKVLILTA